MALKLKIAKTVYDALPDAVKSEYYEKDGDYHLDVDGIEDTGALRRAKDHEVKARKDAETKVRDLEGQVAELTQTVATNASKFEGEVTKRLGAKEAELTKSNSFVQKTLVDSVALSIATKISTAPALLVPHIKARLTADLSGETPVTKILGADGKASELTVEQLSAEFVANKEFSAIIRGNQASGGGAPKNASFNGSAGNRFNQPSDKAFNASTASPQELAAHLAAKKEAESGN